MVAHLNWLDPEITNLVPVLNSYWLMIHVAIITASYGFLALSAILGLFSLWLIIFTTQNKKKRISDILSELTLINERSITITQLNRMCQTPEKGGATFLDLDSQIAAFATRWIQRLLDPAKAFWKDFVWYKIEEAIGEHPICELPREQIFIADIPTKLKKKLSNITGIWKLAFKTYFNIPFKSTPLQDLNIYDLKSTSIYYNKELLINNKVIEPKLIPTMSTIDGIWDEEDNCILSLSLIHI